MTFDDDSGEHPTLPLGPMIDAVFLLLCFFLVTTDFTPLEGLMDAQLPKGLGQAQAQEVPEKKDEVRIEIEQVGTGVTFSYNGQSVPGATKEAKLAELRRLLRQYKDATQSPVAIVDPASDVVFQAVVDVRTICSEEGIKVLMPSKTR